MIAKNVGRIAPGIVAERLIEGLSLIHEVDVLSADYDPSSSLKQVKTIIKLRYRDIHPRINRTIISFFSINPMDIYFSKRMVNAMSEKYDCIFTFVSSDHFVSLLIGNALAKKFNIKHYAHFLDAIPAPGGWTKNKFFFRGVKRFMSKNLPKVNGLFSTNQQMLDYQLSLFRPQRNIVTEVVFNPGFGKIVEYNDCTAGNNTFLFTGGIYGYRTPKHILEAFKRILRDYPNSTLEFVGSQLSADSFQIFAPSEMSKIIIHPYARDLSSFYERSIALLDIDADLPDDVFISSKMVNYLSINRIIISVTGEKSPSRKLFGGLPSIIQVKHNTEEVYEAMRTAIRLRTTGSFADRLKIIEMFGINSIIQKIDSALIC